MTCREARQRLQDLCDTGCAPDGELAAHLAGCTGCSAFASFLAGLGAAAREALDDSAAGLPRPDYPGLLARAGEAREKPAPAAWRSRRTQAFAAAALAAGIGLAVGARTWIGRHDRAAVEAGVAGFVDELFAEPLLAEAGFPVEDLLPGFRDWLEDRQAPLLP